MPIIKDYHLDRDFDDLNKKPVIKTGTIIKSAVLNSIDNVVTPSQFTDDVKFKPSEQDSSNFFEDTASIEPTPIAQPIVNTPIAPSVDESQLRSEIQQELDQQLKAHVDDLMQAIEGLQQARDQVIQSAETQLVDLSLTIAEKIVHKKVEMDPSVIKDVVEDTFNKISGSDRITFKINPDDSEVFNEFQPYLETRLIGVEKITIQQDPTIDAGGCIIETDLGFVDVTIKEKLNIISQTFKKVKATL